MDLSFVSEIISAASETELKHLQDSIQNVSEQASLLKMNIKDQMDDDYHKLLPIIKENSDVIHQVDDLVEDIKGLHLRLDTQTKRDVEDLAEELKSSKELLVEASTIVDVVGKLVHIDKDLKGAKDKAKTNNYYGAAKHIDSACKYLNEECKDLDFLDMYKSLTQTMAYYRDEYSRDSLAEWRKTIKWTHIDGDMENEKLYTSLTISQERAHLENLIKTLELFDVSDKEVATFSDNFLKSFLLPTIRTESSISIKKKNGSAVQEIVISSSSKPKKPAYTVVLENLTSTFEFINECLGVNMHEKSFISYIGEYIADDFLNTLVDECLTDAIPSKREHSKNCTPVIESIQAFQTLLNTIGFVPPSNKLLDNYFGNVDMLFLNKTIEKYFETARQLMKADLHELIEVGMEPLPQIDNTIKSEQSTNKSVTVENVTFNLNDLSPNFFQFPKCSVSQSVESLIDHIGVILLDATDSDGPTCLKLFQLARSIVELYSDIVPMYHSDVLVEIPQYAAIVYNNMMYLAHRTMTMEYDKKPYVSADSVQVMPCFADLVIPLRKEAINVLSQQINMQEKGLSEMVKECGLSSLSEYEELPESAEKGIKKCLRHLFLLKTVWEKVLVANIYSEIMGTLSNVFVKEITNRIVMTRDIRANVATSLAKVLSIIETELPLLFQEPTEVIHQVKCWSRFKELIRVLGASLAEVGERWADGKGPLAVDFTAEEVRQMVKALFQVSDRRAAILSRIK
ncbi:centromere/kinetochore protein zw10 homolog isoform X1 [Halyomorpha halys]|uniref:centromere/kinetochore protein zw10 homolog isoform X1 n=2 Tax=Halyomorpha halys TaxID=286706 RepID=UPI0006D518A6|nr:centromere/kinetochore protein zw10 homolog isoform X1 [Halyomorpha halys]